MANHPHDKNRPESAAILKALEAKDMERLSLALSPRQRAFCLEYVVDFNASAAYIRAGYSPNYADRGAYNLMKNKGIAAYIDHLHLSKDAKIVSVTPDYLVGQITSILSKEGTKDGDKLRGIELLMRHKGMLTDKNETKITIDHAEKQKVEEDAQSFTHILKGMGERAKKEKVEVELV